MSFASWDVCGRCMTTHPLDENYQRPCPKAPALEEPEDEKKFHDVPIIFKGNGFYKTDSRVIKSQSDVL